MSREIKFRAWDKVSKVFLDMEDACYYLLPHGKLVQITRNKRKPDTHIELDAVVQLYTGLKDCDGKEIYESDILKSTRGYVSYTGVVKYNSSYTRFEIKIIKTPVGCEWQIGDEFPLTELNINEAEFKVVGNIHENSELLK